MLSALLKNYKDKQRANNKLSYIHADIIFQIHQTKNFDKKWLEHQK